MSTFEPEHIIALAKLLNGGTRDERREFEDKWRENVRTEVLDVVLGGRLSWRRFWQVENRWKAWQERRASQSQYVTQLEWEAHVVEYVGWAYNLTKSKGGRASPLKADVPLLGPRFLPPTYLHTCRRSSTPQIQPETAYMKAITIVHPLYFDTLAMCPKCDATGADISWSGWTSTGHCEVHGLEREETALGYQLRCKRCAGATIGQKASSKNGEGSHCFTTTNHTFWERREHWQVPGEYCVQKE